MTLFLQIALPILLILFFVLVFLWRSFRTWKQTGIRPYRMGRSDSAHDANAKVMFAVWGLCMLAVLVFSFFPAQYALLAPIAWLENPSLQASGMVLMLLSVVWIVAAQEQMGRAWRIGIDSAHPVELVQSGIFSRSRNPVFLGMITITAGLFLALPSAISLLAFGLCWAALELQVRLEEEHLRAALGQPYLDYCIRVPRWFRFSGKAG